MNTRELVDLITINPLILRGTVSDLDELKEEDNVFKQGITSYLSWYYDGDQLSEFDR